MSRRRLARVLAPALCLVLLLAGPAAAKLIDKLVATVDSEVITLSDLIRHRLIVERTQRTLLQTDEVLREGSLQGVLDELVILTLVYRQAVKLNLTAYDATLLQQQFEEFKSGFVDPSEFEDFLYANGWRTEQELQDVFKRYAIAESFVAKRVNLQVELRLNNYYEEHKDDQYSGQPLETIEQQVRQDLYNEELKNWWDELMRNANVKVLPTPL